MPNHLEKLVPVLMALLLAPFIGLQIGNSSYMIPILLLGVAAALVPLTMPHAVFIGGACLFTSSLLIPFMHQQLTLSFCASIWLTAYTLMSMIVYKDRIRLNHLHYMGIGIACLILFLMFYRGIGLRFLGSIEVGGFRYIAILSAIGFFLSTSCLVIKPKWWTVIFICFGLGSLIPLIADFLILKGIFPNVVFRFVSTSGQTIGSASHLMYGGIDDQFFLRFFGGKDAAIFLSVTLLGLIGARKLFGFAIIVYIVPLLFIAILASVSGFRLAILSVFLIFLMAGLIDKAFTFPRLVSYALFGALGLVLLYTFSTDLPLSVQRSLTFMPFMELEHIARANATGTVHWRLELWKEVLDLVPQYWLIGKGVLFNEVEFLYSRTNPISWALINSSYHNGPLSALVLFGLPGLLLVGALSFLTLKRHYRLYRSEWHVPALQRLHMATFCYITVSLVVFWFIYGDVHVSLPPLFWALAIAEGIYRSDVTQREMDADAALAVALGEQRSIDEAKQAAAPVPVIV